VQKLSYISQLFGYSWAREFLKLNLTKVDFDWLADAVDDLAVNYCGNPAYRWNLSNNQEVQNEK
jgi:hypothetical protein